MGKILVKKSFNSQLFMTAMAGVWGLHDRLSICEETEGIFMFQFLVKEERDQILASGPWFFNNYMVVLVEYDGFGEVVGIYSSSFYGGLGGGEWVECYLAQ